ncbi:acyl-CoA dehydrogenase family protein [Bradyrhizobium tropiciagri]|uniref:acyl-CoA dehydrogenase family protein n=1 Tax=Bradyrhizobium tropiciagri TaxID=312253 RepID=UPI001BA8E3E5|nr:acyl-CoA dehydrogenase family protein [Bradyrhizobium tropiciagri]MBR0898935.1 acyl-CoA dehydrogenase family protein [Bradyrhizobium tropiciagri]
MSWDFETEPDFQKELDWINAFVREEVEPLDYILGFPYEVDNPKRNALVRPLQAEVKKRGLWACHLGPELGGQGYGQVKLALINEILGRSRFGPTVFGCQAPDSGNAEILAHYGTPAQKDRYLSPLLDNRIVSCFAMTEPQGGADPKVFTTRAELVGDTWVLNGEKWFASHAHVASVLIVMAVTDAAAGEYHRLSTFIVPAETAGIEIIRNMPVGIHGHPSHAYIRFSDVRVPADHLLGPRGGGFVVAQTRLGGGRIHHAMRTIGQVQKSFELMCERVLSRETQGSLLADKQMVQEKIADSWMDIEQFRLLVLRTAWKIDKHKNYLAVRKDISAVKALMPKIFHDVAARALHLHGSLGVTPDMPFAEQVLESFQMGLADGPTEVHKITVARQLLRERRGTDGQFPSQYIPTLQAAAIAKYAQQVEEAVVSAI